MDSGTSSSLNLSASTSGGNPTSSGKKGAPGMIQDSMVDSSRSSSIHSAKRSQMKPSIERPSSALARSASRGRVDHSIRDDEMGSRDRGTSSVSYQQVNQMYVAPSPDPELVNQAANAVLQAQTEVHHAQTEAHHTRTEAQRAIVET